MGNGRDAPVDDASAPSAASAPCAVPAASVDQSGVRIEAKDSPSEVGPGSVGLDSVGPGSVGLDSAPTLHASPGSGGGSDLPAGTVLDGVYRVEKRIGRGAMGTVYLVEHLRLGRKFAAKVVSDRYATDADVVARLRNEARVASKIRHENIVDVTHLGSTGDGSLFIVMELLLGRDLRESMVARRERGDTAWLPFEEVRAIARDVMNGLAAAHAEGIVHRDLKPDNVFLVEKDGRSRAKIVDFGISKSQHGAEDLRLTRTGQIIGTPLYMAPEQSRSTSQVDARADVYSLGVMLYEMLTGRLPFEATSLYEIIVQHATEPPRPLRETRADVPPSIDRVVRKCLAKQPVDRWQSVDELHAAWDTAWSDESAIPELEVVVAPKAPSVPPPTAPAPRSPIAAISIAVAAVAVVGAIAWTQLGPATRGPGAPAPTGETPPVGTAPMPAPETVTAARETAPVPETAGLDPAPTASQHLIHSEPEGATVRIGDQNVGETPHSLVVAGEPVRIELRLRGYDSATRSVAATDPATITVTLHRRERRDRGPGLAPR